MWDKAYVINLNERPDRWEWMQQQLCSVGIEAERFSAVSIATMQQPIPEGLRRFLLRVDGESHGFERKLLATWACMQSHLGVITLAKEQGLSSVLIMEDDCHFEAFASAVLRRAAKQVSIVRPDIIYLGGTHKKGGELSKLSANLNKVSRVRLAHAYVVCSSAYDDILEQAPVSGLPIDWFYSEVYLKSVLAVMVSPCVVFQRFEDVSSIEGVERKRKFKSRTFLSRTYSRMRYFI